MKKFFFLLCVFSLALYSKPVFASTFLGFNNIIITSNVAKNTDTGQNATFANTFCYKAFTGTFPSTSSPMTFTSPVFSPADTSGAGFARECGNYTTGFLSGGMPLASFANYPYGGYSVASSDIWFEMTFKTGGSLSDTMDTSGDVYYFQYHVDGSNIATLTPNTSINGIQTQTLPIPDETTPFNVHFTGTYNNESSYTQICAFLSASSMTLAPKCTPIPFINGYNLPYDFYLTLDPNITYSYTLQMSDGNTLYTTATTSFDFTTNALAGDQVQIPVWTPATCDWTTPSTWGGCLLNFFHDAFYPSVESLTQFGSLRTQFANKPPFGYVTSILTTLGSVNDTGTSAFTLVSLPILNTYIFDPIRTALVWVLWFGFAFVLFHRFKNIDI